MDRPAQQNCYPDNAREDVRPFVPLDVSSVLEVGCGRGGFGRTLRELLGPGARLVAVEAVASSADAARDIGCFDEVVTGYFPEALTTPNERFDLVCFNDVLEHVVDPAAALTATLDVLAQGGRVLATIPNVQYASVVYNLIRGRWTYTESGILDRTHLRFFTRSSMAGLFHDAGYTVESTHGINPIGDVWQTDGNTPRRWLKSLIHPALGNARYLQFVLVARRD
ncbi:MAG: class I SAM-dependent methyltransferase [Dermatophilaceae bacterium]|nr:class I SAM-dependent methyltransferase [Dermatophilaceae bacterium]HOF37702.1 class I SAM-dependent methyltransferase [Dermatophilaceae bacterium]HOR14938.1 class I SAM-dependent methyltransferase [Dermatophilaceae bacterium]HQG11423.1 class I SAM-dependent methyltransferase [Dermatophilaceae bacterium]HQK60866.1 class I SAM-dependent methyltransferase [Dermatophilaceae bacterium]